MYKPVEACWLFDKKLLSQTENAWKQDLNRLRKMLSRMTLCSLFYAFEIKERMRGRLHGGGRKQGGNQITK